MFRMVTLNHECKHGQATGGVGKGTDLICLCAELAEEPLQQIGRANADVQAGVELIEREGALNAPLKGVHCLGLQRAPLLNKGG